MDNTLFHHRRLNKKGREYTDFRGNLGEICPVLPLHPFFLFRWCFSLVRAWLFPEFSFDLNQATRGEIACSILCCMQQEDWSYSAETVQFSHHPAGWWFIRDFWVGPTSSVRVREEWVNTWFLSACAQSVPTLWLQRCEWEMSSGSPYWWEAVYSHMASEHKVAQSNV